MSGEALGLPVEDEGLGGGEEVAGAMRIQSAWLAASGVRRA